MKKLEEGILVSGSEIVEGRIDPRNFEESCNGIIEKKNTITKLSLKGINCSVEDIMRIAHILKECPKLSVNFT